MNRFKSIVLLIKTYALVLGIFFVFRFILFLTETDRIDFAEVSILTIASAFLMGIRFDIVISGYILLLPAFLLLVMEIINIKSALLHKAVFYWIFSLFTFSFIICAADIPYFNQFFSRFSVGAFAWMENAGFVFKMIFQEPKYFLILIPLLVLVFAFYLILKMIFNQKTVPRKTNVIARILLSVLFLGIIFLGIRGRIQKKSPIRIGTAYFSNHPFLNQLGLNPVFTFMRTYLDSRKEENKIVHFMEDQKAIEYVQRELQINKQNYDSPVARDIIPDSISESRPNIIVIIMEAMSAAKMSRHGNQYNLTPFLDSLSHKSIYFENIYSAGIHTHNGVFGTLFSFPALFRQHPMKVIKQFNGLSTILHHYGYSATYFTTHDPQFDNVEGFFHANDFETIISQSDYPAKAVKTTLGVPDDYMFEFSIPLLNLMHAKKKPFFVTFMTASDHGPYYIPEYFKPENSYIKHQIVEYADWSLQKFISLASKEEWFSNTIFVFVADHGDPITAPYDISLDYHHTPLIFYAPEIIRVQRTYSCIGGQIDLFPTLMGLLRFPYINNTLGIDLRKEHRPYIFINDDDKIGVLDENFLLIIRDDENMSLHKYRDLDNINYVKEYPEKREEMELYAKSNMQVFQYMLLNNKQFIESGIPLNK
ncbi:MAG: sulfatase-like hydrolase/transferase [Bacteroidales bacterium]|nr:sulfatase-like hydrolase/transferase [Bacteroidales bacterium]